MNLWQELHKKGFGGIFSNFELTLLLKRTFYCYVFLITKNVLTVKRFCENWKTLEEQGRVPSTIYISDKWNVWIKFWARDFCWSFSRLETLRLSFQPTNNQALKVHFLFESAHSTIEHFLIIVTAHKHTLYLSIFFKCTKCSV